jgi:hypothetical protein
MKVHTFLPRYETAIKLILLLLLMPSCVSAQAEEDFPSLEYLRNDYKAVVVVVHIQIREAEISGKVGGYENWRVLCEVLEPFKGKFLKGEVIEYFHGAEAGFKKQYFMGEKIVFLLGEYDQKKTFRYSVLENSTLLPTADRLTKLRTLRKSFAKKRSRVRHNP